MEKLFDLIDNFICKIQEYICIVTGVIVCLLIVAAAFMRYVLAKDFYGSEELILLTAFWLYFMGSSLAARDDTHINADMTSLFVKNEKIKEKIALIKYILSFLISILTTKWSFGYILWSMSLNPKTNVLKIPLTLSQIPILISFVLMDIYLFGYIIKTLKKIKGEGK